MLPPALASTAACLSAGCLAPLPAACLLSLSASTPAYAHQPEPLLRAASMRWFSTMVVGHNLCPFAASAEPALRLAVLRERASLDASLSEEIGRLLAAPPHREATTLLLLPGAAFFEFEALMEYLPHAQAIADTIAARAPIKVLPFHPEAVYSETSEDPADFATRSPVPILHLLRESDVDAAEEQWREAHPEPLYIQERNAAYLRGLGWEKLQSIAQAACPWSSTASPQDCTGDALSSDGGCS
ncbi:hypothetical protein AB1Y20_007627 [Prymnesium parvum]|uniref:DUF1415 domain-containing protein n=1 Tax=Prymnesium parvum TaxID=97485 RepID=A0AB34IVF1_PRYPA